MSEQFNWKDAIGIGDVNSDQRGSGARFNTGKPAMELLPLRQVVKLLSIEHPNSKEIVALGYIADFQEGGDANCILRAMFMLGDPQETLVECAQVFDYGKRKYAEWNWAKGMAWSIPIACATRHLMAMLRGEMIDPVDQNGSGLPHRGHVMCNLMMLATYYNTFKEGDDRPKKWLAIPELLQFDQNTVESAKD